MLVMAYFQAANILIYFSIVLLATFPSWRPGDHSKALLGRRKGAVLILVYVVVLSLYAALVLSQSEG